MAAGLQPESQGKGTHCWVWRDGGVHAERHGGNRADVLVIVEAGESSRLHEELVEMRGEKMLQAAQAVLQRREAKRCLRS